MAEHLKAVSHMDFICLHLIVQNHHYVVMNFSIIFLPKLSISKFICPQ